MAARTGSSTTRALGLVAAGLFALATMAGPAAAAGTLRLDELIAEAIANSPEIRMSQARTEAARQRISQAQSLEDPMIMFGYQNEGFDSITYGEMPDSQLMFSASQLFPYPGKRALKGEMARQEAGNLQALTANTRLTAVRQVTELFYDLFFAYKNLDIIGDRATLYSRLEDAASARYASGMGTLQEVVMAQTEKYMLGESETMQRQKITAVEAMLLSTLGRAETAPLGVPVEPADRDPALTVDQAVIFATEHSPLIAGKKRMIAAAEARIAMAEKEYYPDFTVTGTVAQKGSSEFQDMWSLTTSLNVPLYYQTKQRAAVSEAKAQRSEAEHDLAATRLMLGAALRDNYAMVDSSAQLMELYRTGLIPKGTQDFELALNGYVNGKTEAFAVISRLKNLIDYQVAYWQKFSDKGKAVARVEALLGTAESPAETPAATESTP